MTENLVIIDCKTRQSGHLPTPFSKAKKGMRRSHDGHTWNETYTFAIKGEWAEKERGLLNHRLQQIIASVNSEVCTVIAQVYSSRKKEKRSGEGDYPGMKCFTEKGFYGYT